MKATKKTMLTRVKKAVEWYRHTRVGRALTRYSHGNGGVLAGGVAYSAIFSLFAALAVGYSVFMAVLGGDDKLRDAVIHTIDDYVPGVISTDGSPGLLSPDQLTLNVQALSITGIVAFGVLVFTALSAIGSLRQAVELMFGITGAQTGNAVLVKVREFTTMIGMGLAILTSATLSVVTVTVLESVAEWLNLEGAAVTTWVLRALGFLGGYAIDVLTFLLVFKVLVGTQQGFRKLLLGSCLGAVASSLIRALGTSVVGNAAQRNALLASFATIITLLVWFNLMVRVVLMTAAWTADPPLVERLERSPRRTPLQVLRHYRSGRRWQQRVARDERRAHTAPASHKRLVGANGGKKKT